MGIKGTKMKPAKMESYEAEKIPLTQIYVLISHYVLQLLFNLLKNMNFFILRLDSMINKLFFNSFYCLIFNEIRNEFYYVD